MKQPSERQRVNAGISVGGSSVLAVFVVLCLTTFAVLSLVSAQADLRLSQKATQYVDAYYNADSRGQQLLSQMGSLDAADPDALAAGASALDGTACTVTPEGAVIATFTLDINDTQKLVGEADLTPLLEGAPLRLLRYQVATDSGITLDDPLNVLTEDELLSVAG